MKVLLVGWEFPPHISGRLGTVCCGLINGLLIFDDPDFTLFIPKAYGNENKQGMEFIGTIEIELSNQAITRQRKMETRKILLPM